MPYHIVVEAKWESLQVPTRNANMNREVKRARWCRKVLEHRMIQAATYKILLYKLRNTNNFVRTRANGRKGGMLTITYIYSLSRNTAVPWYGKQKLSKQIGRDADVRLMYSKRLFEWMHLWSQWNGYVRLWCIFCEVLRLIWCHLTCKCHYKIKSSLFTLVISRSSFWEYTCIHFTSRLFHSVKIFATNRSSVSSFMF